MRLLDGNLRESAIGSLCIDEVKFRGKKAGLLSAIFLALLLMGLASRAHTEVKALASSKLITATLQRPLPLNAAQNGDRHSLKGAAAQPSPPKLKIQDIVLLPEDVLLLVQRQGHHSNNSSRRSLSLPPKEQLTCLFDRRRSTPVRGVDYCRNGALVRCSPPQDFLTANGVTTGLANVNKASHPNASLSISEVKRLRNVELLHNSVTIARLAKAPMAVKTWNRLVFEIWVTEEDVVLFAKGINLKRGRDVNPAELSCVFGADDDTAFFPIETEVSISSQEVFRCAHPPLQHRQRLMGTPVTLRWGPTLIPSVAYYEDIRKAERLKYPMQALPYMKEDICACTMVFNVAKFLAEWSTFHQHIGVEKFIFYDNNSEDGLEEALAWLRERQFQVTRYPWPWPKTQEAGFSHCVLAAKHSSACDWVLFADVDEFLFPAAYLPPAGRMTPLRQLITDVENRARHKRKGSWIPKFQPTGKRQNPAILLHQRQTVHGDDLAVRLHGRANDHLLQAQEAATLSSEIPSPSHVHDYEARIGQISFKCRDFGASNLTHHPARGVTQGYVCRNKQELRHKSLVKVGAVHADLQNVVHHFHLLQGFSTVTENPTKAVINHYKYQAWPEFRRKFRRRVSAYVADWKEQRNMNSRDRTPGLGVDDIKPKGWETSFCEVTDKALRDYCSQIFAVNESSRMLSWQLP
ncbi:hypothetical protein KP509_17G073700 [Ceratopteris richardii]|uniref:Glycosyltransferase family 92 protein n=1 Tax=Ceratopteris richardii TaxID=49495 RepID=A0A8T2SVC6_CERRI|nr:hypothetical protein KP509_17G073700 [Ceratopteris richardii]KAH7373763.1 hypothetical protein KP509_17G073700 [Ceratopteris richardii]